MGRPAKVEGGRPIVVAVRLTTREAQLLDTLRHGLSRSDYIRAVLTGGPEQVTRVIHTRSTDA